VPDLIDLSSHSREPLIQPHLRPRDVHVTLPQDRRASLADHVLSSGRHAVNLVPSAAIGVTIILPDYNEDLHSRSAVMVGNCAEDSGGLREDWAFKQHGQGQDDGHRSPSPAPPGLNFCEG